MDTQLTKLQEAEILKKQRARYISDKKHAMLKRDECGAKIKGMKDFKDTLNDPEFTACLRMHFYDTDHTHTCHPPPARKAALQNLEIMGDLQRKYRFYELRIAASEKDERMVDRCMDSIKDKLAEEAKEAKKLKRKEYNAAYRAKKAEEKKANKKQKTEL